jgi:hypothetical protein
MNTHTVIDTAGQDHLKFLVRQLHRLGERPLYEFFREIENGGDLRATLETYAALPREIVLAFNGDRFESLREFHGGQQ